MQIKLAAQRRQQVLHFLHGDCFFAIPNRMFSFIDRLGKSTVPGERDKCPADEHELALIWVVVAPNLQRTAISRGNTGNNFINVDLPAPLPPSRAWTSPYAT